MARFSRDLRGREATRRNLLSLSRCGPSLSGPSALIPRLPTSPGRTRLSQTAHNATSAERPNLGWDLSGALLRTGPQNQGCYNGAVRTGPSEQGRQPVERERRKGERLHRETQQQQRAVIRGTPVGVQNAASAAPMDEHPFALTPHRSRVRPPARRRGSGRSGMSWIVSSGSPGR